MKPLSSLYLAPQREMDFHPIVAAECGINERDIFLRTNRRPIATARHIAIWLQYNENLSKYNRPKLDKIAAKYPGQTKKHMDHSSIIHSYKAVNDIMDVDRHFRTLIYRIQIKIWGEIKYRRVS